MICRYSFKFLLALLFLFSCLSLCAQYAQVGESSSRSLALGLEAYSRSDWDAAIRHFRQASSENPSNSEPFFWLIMAQISKGDYEQAFSHIDGFMLVFRNDKHAPTVLYQKGRLEFLTSRYDRAMETLSSFVDANPNHRLVPSAYYWMAEICFASERYEEAKRLYEYLIEFWPQSVKHEAASYRLALLEQRASEEELLASLSGMADPALLEELEASLNDERQRNSTLEEEMALLEAQKEDLIEALIAAGVPLPESVRSERTAQLEEAMARDRERARMQEEAMARDRERARILEELLRKYSKARDIYEEEEGGV